MEARVGATRPPSALAGRAWTVAALILPIVLPVAIVYARRARREAAACVGGYPWPKRLIDRPVVFSLVVWLVFFPVLYLALAAALSAFFHIAPV